MQMNHSAFEAPTPALRRALKRGLARQAPDLAGRSAPNPSEIFGLLSGLRPNEKSVERLAQRLKPRSGLSRVARTHGGKGLSVIFRMRREIEARVAGAPLFQETGLIYLRAECFQFAGKMAFDLKAISFCCHALERLVERSDLPLTGLLPQIDAEVAQMFAGLRAGADLTDGGDQFLPARVGGVWAGGEDEMAMDPDWGLRNACGHLPLFSARTFLSEAEMRPTLFLRYKNDPRCQMR